MAASNFHTHSTFCDGKDSVEELVAKAIELGSGEIGFSSHSYVPFDDDYCLSPEKEKEYIETVLALKEKYRGKIKIYLGIEQDYYSPLPEYDYDYMIGSVHYVKKDGVYIPVDNPKERLVRGVERYYGGDYYAMVKDYYENVADLYNKTGCNIIGHFDIVTKYNRAGDLFDTNDQRYVCAYEKALAKLSSCDCAFEINTRGSASAQMRRNFPEEKIEKKIRALGAPIVYSSDCHNKEFLLFGIPEGYDNLSNIPRIKR